MTPFYEKAHKLFTDTQNAQIIKGLQKYPKPFNPHDWTPQELLNHALEEVVDTTHYLVGLKDLLDAKDAEIAKLKQRCLDYERKLNAKNSLGHTKSESWDNKGRDKLVKPHAYFDPDDQ